MNINRTFNILTLAIVFLLCGTQAFAYNSNSITPELTEEMSRRSDNEKINIVIIMKQQYNSELLANRAANFTNRAERRDFVVNELTQYAEATQYELHIALDEMERHGMVADTKVIWIANAISLSATKDAIDELAKRSDIALIGYDKMEQVISEPQHSPSMMDASNRSRDIGSHITHINADDVWALGYTGQDVVVAIIDSGVNYNHLDLADHLWDGGSEFPHHGYDVMNNDNDPMDDLGHGTHCAGIICGDGTAGEQAGVAPDATLMCVKATDDEGASAPSYLANGMQWALEHGCDLMSISMGFTGQQASSMQLIRNTCINVLNAGVVASCAAGNEGNYQSSYPVPYNVRYPGSCPPPYLDPDQLANPGGLSAVICVGCIRTNNTPSSFTSHGPSCWTNTTFGDYPYNPGIGLIRPDVCAPGDWVLSLDFESIDDYYSEGGTSQATPCLTGTIALMLSKEHNLSPAQICQIVEETAVPLSRTKSNITGSGCIDALAAVNAVNGVGVQNYTIIVSANPSNGGTVIGGGIYQEEQNCTVTATANLGFTFTNWTENGNVISDDVSYSFTVNGNRNLVANFTAIQQDVTITVTANPIEGGTVTGAGIYNLGETATLTATANEGYYFMYWTENGEQVSTSATYSFIVMEDADFVANFAEGDFCSIIFELYDSYGDGWDNNYLVVTDENGVSQQLTIDDGASATYILPFLVGSHLTLTWIMGSWTSECSFTVSYENGIVIYEGTNLNSSFQYEFDVDCNGATPTYYTITATANPTEGGTVTGADEYQQGETCTLMATANEGYVFVNWTENGEMVSSEAVYSFTVTEDADFVANFVEGDFCSITFALYDAYGDGWNGNYLVVTDENGVSQQLTIVSGSTATYTLLFLSGSHLTLSWIEGNWTDECSFTVSYENGTLICEGSDLSGDFQYEFDVNCNGSSPTYYTVTATANPTEGGTVTGAGEYEEGTSVTVIATANDDYVFINWTEGDVEVSTDASYTFTITEDHDLVANFILPGILGDANEDNIVNIADVQAVVAYLYGYGVPIFNVVNADANQDGIINIADIQAILMIIQNEYPAKSMGVKPVIYTIENGVLNISLTEELSGVQIKVDAPIEITDTDIFDGFVTIIDRVQGTDSYMFLAYSLEGKTVNPGKYSILNIADGAIEQIIFSTPTAATVDGIEGDPLGIADESVTVNVYPNPTDGMITIEADNISEIVIMNMMGQIVGRYADINGSSANIDMSGYENGTYLVRIITDSSVIVKNVVKM